MSLHESAIGEFERFIRAENFPCVGARSALATKNMMFADAGDLTKPSAGTILASLQTFAAATQPRLTTFVALYAGTPDLSERGFETALWRQLAILAQEDRHRFAPDPSISTDPESSDFAISIGGKGFFVVGMHPGASRLARRAPFAALAFNRHDQFRALKASGGYGRMRDIVRRRDIALQGDTNPMLADHGDRSEASQYSGRDVSRDWVCPFMANRHAA